MTWPPRTRSARVRARFVLTALAVLATACSYTTDLRLPDLGAESSVVFSADGALLATLHAEENREVVALDAISPYLRNAVVAIEDARFFDHEGVDLRAIARALKRDAEEGQIVEGGSTITQQYVRAVMLDDSKTFSRKLREAVLAFQVERTYTKEEILERYLNTVYFGNGAYGAQAAARVFFGKDAIDLELAEAALLAGVLQAPEDLNPFADADAARRRRDRVLDRMEELGRARPSDVAEARRAPLPETPSGPSERYPAGHFVERVKQFVLEDPRFGETPEARRHLLFQGGLRIETTLDPTVQALAEMAVARVLSDPAADPGAALVALEPGTGHVRAYVGGRDFFGDSPEAKFDLAGQGRRQTGSSFKPFVLAAALEAGVPLDRVYDAPARIEIPLGDGQPDWEVTNYDGSGSGRMNLVEATVHSVNTVYAQLVMDVGPERAVDMASRLGVVSPLQPYPSAALGTNGVTVLDMASAFATFAADGLQVDPVFVTRITTRDGTILYDASPRPERALSTTHARQVTEVLGQVVTRGTGINARIGRPVAGKTGTAEEWQDAWFVGYTPQLATAVWVGFPDAPRSMVPPVTRVKVTGGSWPAQIWQLFTSAALAEEPIADFPPAEVDLPTATTVPTATVPSVVGMRGEDARILLEDAGYTVRTEGRPDRDYPPGTVLDQMPSPNMAAAPGSEVLLVLADGAPRTTLVPSVLGRYADEAGAALADARLVAQVVVEAEPPPGDPARAGRIWKQAPLAGGQVDEGSTVTVWVNPG